MAPREGDMVGRYRLDRVLGSGGMGIVYAATDTRLERQVALKVMSAQFAGTPGARARFDREATSLARLESPHVITVHDHGEHPPGPGGAPYLVTRLVRGGDLASLLSRRGPLPPSSAALVAAQVAEALRDAHAAGVVHRDVKPANVLLRDVDETRPFAILCDFGIATATREEGTALTRTGGVTGTWGYLSPERIDGGPGTPVSDIYALGCLLWTALTGSPPYVGSDYVVAEAHHRAPVPQLSGSDRLTHDLNEILAATMAKDPARRPGSAEVVRRRLAEIADGDAGYRTTPVAPGHAPGHGPERPRRRGGTVAAVAAAVVLVGGVLTGAALWPRGDEDTTATDATDTETGGTSGTGGGTDTPSEESVTGDTNDDGLGDLMLQIGRSADAQRLTWVSDGAALLGPNPTPGTRGLPLRGDLDGDGRPDLVVVSRGGTDQQISVELASGETVRSRAPQIALARLYTVIGDVDGDGADDVSFWGLDSTSQLRFYTLPSTGGGELGEREEIGLPALDGGYLQPGDYDGDGRLDLAHLVTRSEYGTVTVQMLLGSPDDADGSGFVAVAAPQDSTGIGELVLSRTADPDGDGVDELVQVTTTTEERVIEVWQVDDGEVGAQEWYRGEAPEGSLQLTPAVSDVDGDGLDDLVLWRSATESAIALDVVRSTGSAYQPGAEWTQWECAPTCFRPLAVIGSTT